MVTVSLPLGVRVQSTGLKKWFNETFGILLISEIPLPVARRSPDIGTTFRSYENNGREFFTYAEKLGLRRCMAVGLYGKDLVKGRLTYKIGKIKLGLNWD